MRTTLIVLALVLPLPVFAAQSLVPSPYPSGSPGAAPLNPAPMGTGAGQADLATPYPQASGGNSQGNPSDVTPGAAQQRVPSTFKRNYGVDQH